MEISLSPVKTAGGPRVIAAVRDVTARKRDEEALEARATELQRSNDEFDRFAHAISHDIQEPLRVVAGFS